MGSLSSTGRGSVYSVFATRNKNGNLALFPKIPVRCYGDMTPRYSLNREDEPFEVEEFRQKIIDYYEDALRVYREVTSLPTKQEGRS